ncbi:MAG: methyl-accepting chemotaxis protein [Fervidobacterium sp.]|uniref:methyl-accepting chemotaxis protein n=1 Tax=Fervidobacterium TaxID=2422 RepID=UPI0021FD2609|nr:chemotaxis protein [Fervidobacterium riparium]
MKARLSVVYALTLSLLVMSLVALTLFLVFPQSSKIISEMTLQAFLDEVKILTRFKNYDVLFTQKPEFGYYYVLDSNAIVAYHNDPSKIGLNAKEQVPGLFEYMQEKKAGVYSYDYQGIKRYVAFSYDGNYYIAHAATEDELFGKLNEFRKKFFSVSFPILIVSTIVLGFFVGEFLLRGPRKQISDSKTLVKNVSESVIQTSSSASEIKAMAENTERASMELDKSMEEFAAYMEESRAEIENTLLSLSEFTDTIEQITEYTSKLATLTETLSKVTDRITDISDNITVLAINASIETSKQNIDRDGLSRIAEMIMELSNSTRNLAKESKQSLSDVEKIVTSTILITEKITKNISSVRDSLNVIQQVTAASTNNVDKLVNVSKTNHDAVEELYAGIEQLEEAMNNIKFEIEKFAEAISKFVI